MKWCSCWLLQINDDGCGIDDMSFTIIIKVVVIDDNVDNTDNVSYDDINDE